jgi:hypothetical protein
MMNWLMLHKALNTYMKFSKLGLLTLLISLFILNSCKNQDGIGLGVDPEDQLNGTLIADTNIVVNTVAEDTIPTAGLTITPLAYFKDPVFGTTEANIAAVLTLPANASSWAVPTGKITIDSAVLVLPYAEGFYGDSLTSSYKLNVYQLGERVKAQAYYNTKHWSHEPTLLGTKAFAARPHDSIRIYQIIDGAPDTLIKVKAQIRVPISKAFISTNLFGASSTVLGSSVIFQNTVKGLYLTLDKGATTGPGGTLMMALDTSAKVNVYYKNVTGTTTDTTMLSLPFANNITEIKHTHSAEVKAALNQTSTNGLFYLEGLAGTRAKVSFPDIKKTFAALGSDVVLNRAELVIKVAPGSTTPYAPLGRLTLYKYDIAKQRVQVQDASAVDPRATVFGGYYSAAKGEYHFIVTSFIQDLYRGKTVDYGTYLAATPATITDVIGITPTATVAPRTIGIGKNSPDRIKLNIIYTKVNK